MSYCDTIEPNLSNRESSGAPFCDTINPALSNRLRSDLSFCDSLPCCGLQAYDDFDCKPRDDYDPFSCLIPAGNDCDFLAIPPLNPTPCCGINQPVYLCPVEFTGYVCPVVTLC